MPELFFSLHDSNDGDYGQSFFKDLIQKSWLQCGDMEVM